MDVVGQPKPDAMDTEAVILCVGPIAKPSNPPDQYSRLIRVTAWVFRLIRLCKEKADSTSCLTVQEFSSAEVHHLQTQQQQFFGEEDALLKLRRIFPDEPL